VSSLSSYQKDFTGPDSELALGYLYGIRAFSYYPRGHAHDPDPARLYGRFDWLPWRPGVNHAICGEKERALFVRQVVYARLSEPCISDFSSLFGNEAWLAVAGLVDEQSRSSVEKSLRTFPGAQVIGVKARGDTLEIAIMLETGPREPACLTEDCACGFYAFTSSDAVSEIYVDRAFGPWGVIRCSGRALLGARGFRVEHAEIIALVDKLGDGQSHPLLRQTAAAYQVPIFDSGVEAYEWLRANEPEAARQLVAPLTRPTMYIDPYM
jgi:hypothetical protein